MTHYLQDYSHFNSTEQMDNDCNKHISRNYSELNRTDRAILDMIRRYSVKYGAAHLKHDTIAATVKKSNSTVRRSIVKLEKLGIIERVKFIRRVMSGLGANIYAILPFNSTEKSINRQSEIDTRQTSTKSDTATTQATKSENEPLLSKSLNNLVTNTSCTCSQDSLGNFYDRFKSHVKSFVGQVEQKLISRLYGVYRSQTIKLLRFDIHKGQEKLFESLAINAITVTMQATKKKNIRNKVGYFSGVLSNLIEKALFSDAFMLYDKPIDYEIVNF